MKYYFPGIGIALCTLIVTGCSKELESIAPPVVKQVTMAMQANTNLSQTRADYTDDGSVMKFSWRSGDELSVVVDGVTGNENCQLSTSEAGISAAFSGNVTDFTGSKDVYAFYPYNSTPYTVTGSGASATATLTLPNPQAYTVGGAISNSFMTGVGTGAASDGSINASASMKQVMSIIKLNITNAPGKVTGVKLRCSEALFPTTAVVKLSDGTISNPGTLVNELSMTVTDETEGTDKAVSFAMFPVDLTDKRIHIEVSFVSNITKTITKNGLDFKRNLHYNSEFDATVNWINSDGITFRTDLAENKYQIDNDKNGIRLLSRVAPAGSNGPVTYGTPGSWFSADAGVTRVEIGDLINATGEGIRRESSGAYVAKWLTDVPNMRDVTKVGFVTTIKDGVKNVSKFNVTLEGQYVSWTKNYFIKLLTSSASTDARGRILSLNDVYGLTQGSTAGVILYRIDQIFRLAPVWKIVKITARGGGSTTPLRNLNDGSKLADYNSNFFAKAELTATWGGEGHSTMYLGSAYPYPSYGDIEVTLQRGSNAKDKRIRLLRVYITFRND